MTDRDEALPRPEDLERAEQAGAKPPSCHFVEKRENVLLIGPAGVGKSHLAQANGERACRAGHSVAYVSAHGMLSQLRAARADHSLDRRMQRFTAPDLLIVDDLRLRPLDRDKPIDHYEVIRARYERGSMIGTSNRARWMSGTRSPWTT